MPRCPGRLCAGLLLLPGLSCGLQSFFWVWIPKFVICFVDFLKISSRVLFLSTALLYFYDSAPGCRTHLEPTFSRNCCFLGEALTSGNRPTSLLLHPDSPTACNKFLQIKFLGAFLLFSCFQGGPPVSLLLGYCFALGPPTWLSLWPGLSYGPQ